MTTPQVSALRGEPHFDSRARNEQGVSRRRETCDCQGAVRAAVSKPPSETLTPLLTQALPNVKGKTFTSAIVTFPPAARAMPHRHGSAFVYAFVLEGSVRSQVTGEPVRTFHQGENWVEQPGAHHQLTENSSQTEPAKLLVVFVSDTGEELKVNDPGS